MPIKAKNIIVGGNKPPTVSKPDRPSTLQLIKEKALKQLEDQKKLEEKKKKEEEKKIVVENKVLTDNEPRPKYIKRQDGELIRHINRKSDYIRDLYEIE
jgi:hypothetical protein